MSKLNKESHAVRWNTSGRGSTARHTFWHWTNDDTKTICGRYISINGEFYPESKDRLVDVDCRACLKSIKKHGYTDQKLSEFFLNDKKIKRCNMKTIGYARVSNVGQKLDFQLEKLKAHGCDKIFQEKVSGTTEHRTQLKQCLEYLGEGDSLVITKFDRLARSELNLIKIINQLQEKGVELTVLDGNIDTSSLQKVQAALRLSTLGFLS